MPFNFLLECRFIIFIKDYFLGDNFAFGFPKNYYLIKEIVFQQSDFFGSIALRNVWDNAILMTFF